MAYIGNTVQNQGFAPAIDYFNGDGVTVTFTLSRPVASVAQLTAVIENVVQNPSTAFTISGNQITFTSAPPSGTNNIWVEYTSLVTTYAAISQDPSVVGDITASGGYLAAGDFGNSYVDGTVVDYVTGASRITTGPIDDIVFYHGGTASRSEIMRMSYTGNVGIGTSSPGSALDVQAVDGRSIIKLTATTNTNPVYSRASNAGGYLYLGRDGSAGVDFGAGAYAAGVWSTGAYPMVFGTNGTERMRIDSSGRVTMPYQPGFYAYKSNGPTGTSGEIVYNATFWNTGSAYNTSTGRFTAPISGYYLVGATGIPSNSNYCETAVYRNNSEMFLNIRGQGVSGGTTQAGSGGSCIVYLNANDYISASVAGGNALYGSGVYTSFFARLIG